MRKLSAVAFIVITIMMTAPLPAIAYTQADADACTPDAMRHCASAIPDVSRVAFCLAHNKQQLNSACAAVFNRPRGASATRERRGNIQRLISEERDSVGGTSALGVANEQVSKRPVFSRVGEISAQVVTSFM